jgi:hypothetical protein
MRMNFSRSKSITRLAALMLLILFLSRLPGSAEVRQGELLVTSWSFGFVPLQKARFTVVNKADPERPGASEPIHAQLKLFNGEGTEIYQSPDVVIPPDRFSSIDVERGQLSDGGDPLQVACRC